MKALRFLILVVMALLVAFAWAGGSSAPPRVLPVELKMRDDGAHAFMPKLETALAPAKYVLPVQEPDPNPVPSGWSGAWLYRVTGPKEDRASAGALKNIGTLTRGKLRVSVDGYAGVTLRQSVPVVALLAGLYSRPFDQDFTVGLHLGAIMSGVHPASIGIGASANWKF